MSSAHFDSRCFKCNRQFRSREELSSHYVSSPSHPHCALCEVGFADEEACEKVRRTVSMISRGRSQCLHIAHGGQPPAPSAEDPLARPRGAYAKRRRHAISRIRASCYDEYDLCVWLTFRTEDSGCIPHRVAVYCAVHTVLATSATRSALGQWLIGNSIRPRCNAVRYSR